MPTIGRRGPFRIFFYSADCAEPAHGHVERADRVAKVRLHDLTIARTGGFPAPELERIMQVVRDGRASFQEVWNEQCDTRMSIAAAEALGSRRSALT